jgi:methyl-accepting chemotaxis protein
MARDLEVGVTITAEDKASAALAATGGQLGKLGDQTDVLAGAFRRLGGELEQNLNKKIEANNKFLGAAIKQYEAGQISARDYAKAEEAVAAANAKLRARIGETTKALTESNGAISQLGDFLAGHFVVTLGDAQRAFSQIVSVVGQFVKAAQESEDAAKGLNNALASVGAGGASISAALEDQAAALQKVTRFSDEAIVKGQTFAAAFIKSEDALKRVTVASTDLATGLGIDLQTAFELVTKASQGHTETLARYGITIDETVPKAQRFESLLGQINDRFGGRAAADARTYSGEVAKVGNAFGEVEEAIGRLITSSEAGNQTLHDLATLLNAAAEGANAASGETGFITESLDRFNTGMLRSIPLIGDLVIGLKRVQEATHGTRLPSSRTSRPARPPLLPRRPRLARGCSNPI